MPVKAVIDENTPPSQIPKRRWEIVSRHTDRLFSTVGFTKAVGSKQKEAAHGASIRLEIQKTAFRGEHKDRRVVKVSVPTAREIAESIIEACDQAERGEAVYTKRS